MPSERLLQVFHAEHPVPRSQLSGLSDADIRELEAAVTGTGDRRYFARAVDALVTARGAGATRALAQVLGDEREHDTLRAAAASQLGRVGPTAERPLLTALDSDESTVVIAAAGALGRVGSPRAIEPLGRLADRDDLLGQQARFSRTLIAFRGGVSGHEPRRASELKTVSVPADRAAPILARPLLRDEVAAALADLRQAAAPVQLDPQATVGLSCGRERLVVGLDAPMRAVETPAVIGAVGHRAEADRSFSLARLVLAWPAGDEPIEVAVFRLSGHQVLAGTATVEKAEAQFELRAVEAQGNVAVELRGAVQGGRLVSVEGRSSPDRAVRGAPTPE